MVSESEEDELLVSLASSALTTEFEDLPDPVVENTRLRVLDMIGCALGGSRLGDVRSLASMFGRPVDGTEASGIGFGRTFPVQDAAMVNCVAGRSFDWGPLTLVVDGKRVPSHISETSILTGLAVGESVGVSGRDLLTAIIVGDDLAARIWLAAGERPMPGEGSGPASGFEQWGTVTTFAAATIASRLFDLGESELIQALGLSVSMMSGAGHGLWDGATSFKLSQGAAARNGILAARMAKSGWTGIEEPLLGGRGYYNIFETGCGAPGWLREDLGRTFIVERCFKLYPGGRPTDAPIEASIRLAQEEDIDPGEIEEFVVRPKALASHYAKPYELGTYPTGHALFSFKFAAANAVVNRRAGNAEYTPAGIQDPGVQNLIERTTLEAIDRDLESWGAEVEARTTDGRILTRFVPVPRGDPPNPMSTGELIEKFKDQAEFAGNVSSDATDEILDQVLHIEDMTDISAILALAKGSIPGHGDDG